MSCVKDTKDMTVKGQIKGLKKGTIYLKKANDSTIVIIDSTKVNGTSTFEMYAEIDSPEMFFIELDKTTKADERISFFGNKGITEINTTLKDFAFKAEIKGSKQQILVEEYLTMISKFNDRNLDLTKSKFDALKAKDTIAFKDFENKLNSFTKRKYLYTTNFAVKNNNSEVAPYLALTEIYDANITLLDTINNSLTKDVKNSKYGIALDKYITKIKENK
jgi:hypothetical protein